MFRFSNLDEEGPLSPPVAFGAHDRGRHTPCARYVAFWLKPISIFGLSKFTMFIERLHPLTISSDPSPALL